VGNKVVLCFAIILLMTLLFGQGNIVVNAKESSIKTYELPSGTPTPWMIVYVNGRIWWTGTDCPSTENYTTYTEVEPDDRIQKTAYHIDILAKRNEDSYLYKDYGVDYFQDFEHFVNVKCVNTSEDTASASVWCVSNDLDDVRGQRKVDNEYYVIEFYRTDASEPVRRILLGSWDGTKDFAERWIINTANFTFAYGTWYYFRIKRVETSLTCKIYDTAASRDAESADEHLLDTLSLTVDGDDKFRYVYACCSYNLPNTPEMNLDIECLDLQEIIPTPPPVGGIYIPINKLELLAPYIGVTILIALAVMAIVFFKRKKRKL